MQKAGDDYRELVGTVAAALDPGSVVKTEQWSNGPDGERDLDVEMRGTMDDKPHFVLIECKDHKRTIGIAFPATHCSDSEAAKPRRHFPIHDLSRQAIMPNTTAREVVPPVDNGPYRGIGGRLSGGVLTILWRRL